MSLSSCCIGAAFAKGYTNFAVGDNSAGDLYYQQCMQAGGVGYTAAGAPCNSNTGTGGFGPATTPGTSATPGPATTQQTCPPFSISDPGPALQCFAFEILRYLFVNLAAAAVFAYGLKLTFPEAASALATTAAGVATGGESEAAEAAVRNARYAKREARGH
jgi:hypothetical protein